MFVSLVQPLSLLAGGQLLLAAYSPLQNYLQHEVFELQEFVVLVSVFHRVGPDLRVAGWRSEVSDVGRGRLGWGGLGWSRSGSRSTQVWSVMRDRDLSLALYPGMYVCVRCMHVLDACMREMETSRLSFVFASMRQKPKHILRSILFASSPRASTSSLGAWS